MAERDLSQLSLLELFRMDAEGQIQALTAGLLALERNPAAADQLEACMRAAHSLKGAARVVGLEVGVRIAHVMESAFVAAQRGELSLRQAQIDVLLRGVDLLNRIAGTPEAEIGQWAGAKQAEVGAFDAALSAVLAGGAEPAAEARPPDTPQAAPAPAAEAKPAGFVDRRSSAAADVRENAERVLRVTAENLDRLLGLAAESLVESRWLKPFAGSLLRLKRLQGDAGRALDGLAEALAGRELGERGEAALVLARRRAQECQQLVSQRLIEMELFDSRSSNLAHRLYDAVLASRMRPFADGVRAFPRMVRDLGRSLGKEVRLEIVGQDVQVDRDILEKLDAPLGHLLRNAVDHGVEEPAERRAAGKPAEAAVRIEARHAAGLLQIAVSDDGRGVDLERLRAAVVARNLTTAEVAGRLSEAEMLEFLFLPGFTMKDTVTEISGRGVGLDVVQTMIKQVRGTIHVSSRAGGGTRFQLQLPLTLSVVRTLLVIVGGEPYAFPLANVVRTLQLPRQRIRQLEGRQHFEFDGRSVGLVSAHQILGGEPPAAGNVLPVVVVGGADETYGLVMDRFLGERELVVQPLDPRLGKVPDIAAGALMEDGAPALIVDVDDLLRSVAKLVAGGRLSTVQRGARGGGKARKRVLVVEDSLTVRELERKLLDNAGYEVEVAVDGMDGWNALRTGRFDLVVSDIDMPRMDGIELVTLIKKDAKLKSLPVLIVSYKDREEDRQRGLEAGADYYLTKSSFHDETLLQAVADMIGAGA
jgi:two-component system, chemotaxis family, sensor histidine kinase and response regulator WspE